MSAELQEPELPDSLGLLEFKASDLPIPFQRGPPAQDS